MAETGRTRTVSIAVPGKVAYGGSAEAWMSPRSRVLGLVAAAVLLFLIAGGYVLHAAGRDRSPPRPVPGARPLDLDRPGQLLFRTAGPGPGGGRLAGVALAAPGGPRTITDRPCVRVYAAGGTGVCLTVERAAIPKIYAVVLDRGLHEVRKVPLPGAPSRARVSVSGRMVSWTVFVSGDSYLSADLSTRTGVLDTRTGRLVPSLEEFTLTKDGARYRAPDLNYWGVTFTRDDDVFYATVRTKGATYLVEGRMSTRTVRTLRRDVECPSISPDGSRLVFKKPTGDRSRPWRLHTLDVRTLRETALAEPASVDDQADWLDDHTVIYGRLSGGATDIWQVPSDGTGTPLLLLRSAFSPAVIH